MVIYFYGKVTKSGKKLLINVPYDERNNFKLRSKVKVFLLDIEEIIVDEVVRKVDYEKKGMEIFDAAEIIKRYDKNWKFEGKPRADIIEYAKKILESNLD